MGLRGFDDIDLAGAKVLRTVPPDAPPAPVPSAPTGPGPVRQEFTVEGWRPPSLNQLMRGRLRDRMRLGRRAVEEICWSAFRDRMRPADRVRRRVSLVITLSGRQRPYDCDAAWKALLDALKSAAMIIDDSARWCELGPVEYLRGGTTSTKIILEDLEGANP